MTIIEPSQSSNKTDADAAWEKETTNAINALQSQIQNLGSGVVSGNNRILVYADDAAGTGMSYEQRSLAGFSAVLTYSGELPTLPVAGLIFSPFSDAVVNTTIKQYIRTSIVQTSAPTAASTYNTRTGEWSSSVGWQKTIPQADNVPTWVCHAIISGSGNVTISWTNPTLFYSNNSSTGVVYYTEPQSATPSKPTATDFNFTTFVMTFGNMENGNANKWQQQPFSYDVTDTAKKQYTCEYVAEKHPGSSTATVTFGSPRGYVGIADDLESNNYNAGSAGWKIKRDTGFAEFGAAAIRGSLTVGQLPSGTLNATDVGNSGSTVISGNRLTTGNINANSCTISNINASNITTGTMNANKIVAGSITTDRVVGQAFTSFFAFESNLSSGVTTNFSWQLPISGQNYQAIIVANFFFGTSANNGSFANYNINTSGSGIGTWNPSQSVAGVVTVGNHSFLSHFGNSSSFFNLTGGATYTSGITATTNMATASVDVLVLVRNR